MVRSIIKIFKVIRLLIINLVLKVFSLSYKIDDSIVLCGSMNDKYYGNPRFMFEYLHENGKFRPVWITGDKKLVERLNKKGFESYYRYSMKTLELVVSAKFYLINHHINNIFPYVRKQTIVINLWHGSPLKKMGFDSNAPIDRGLNPLIDKLFYYYRPARWDYICVAHERFVPFFMSSMGVPRNRIIVSGLPRNDILFDFNYNKEMYKKLLDRVKFDLDVPEGKVILYAPTFRDYDNEDHKNQIELFLQDFCTKFAEKECSLLLRLHSYDRSRINIDDFNKHKIVDVSSYEEIQDLYLITDLLITDYSSVMFDFSVLNRPVILFAHDLNKYSNIRGFYFNMYNDPPFEVVREATELLGLIEKRIEYVPNINYFNEYNIENASRNILEFMEAL